MLNKKRILFLVSSMQGGGAERVAALLCNHWAALGHDVTLMPTFSGRGDCYHELEPDVKLDFLADRVGTTQKSIFIKLKRFLTLRRAIKELRPDVIVSFMTQVNVVGLLAAVRLNIPVVVSERIYPPACPLSGILECLRQTLYPQAQSVVVQTEQALQWLKSVMPNAKGVVVPNAVALPLASSQPRVLPDEVIDRQKKVLLAVGRLDQQKGFDLLLKAFGQVVKLMPEWDLVILGEGDQRLNLEGQRDAMGLQQRIHLPGRIGNLPDWYTRANLYVLSSRFEGFPNTLLEAMAHGLPVVSFDCDSGPRDLIRHETDGLLVEPNSGAEGLADSLLRLMADDERRKALGHHAVEVRERFSMDRIAELWSQVLGLER